MEFSLKLVFEILFGFFIVIPLYKLGRSFRQSITSEVTKVQKEIYRFSKFDIRIWRQLVLFGRFAESLNGSVLSALLIIVMFIILAAGEKIADFPQTMLFCGGGALTILSMYLLSWAHYPMADLIATDKKYEEYAVKQLIEVSRLTTLLSSLSILIFLGFIFWAFSLKLLGIYLGLMVLIFVIALIDYFEDAPADKKESPEG